MPVQRVVHAVEPGVALQQEPVDGLVLLVGLPADERLHEQRVLADQSQQWVCSRRRARQGDEELALGPRRWCSTSSSASAAATVASSSDGRS